jgi:hypothetical protein
MGFRAELKPGSQRIWFLGSSLRSLGSWRITPLVMVKVAFTARFKG